ncbi:probable salivary secreted peptide [Nilaparvata lugens]|uniref:probable salivary secreted peptide n=1 Tax=Nilaparvata lugens TaxID=108931 RepID=UPI000B98B62C|nr:probable salivary secreted peptide [Nilaparvata lugens]XP_039276772.1 probable salivary secreted peptide [Nilaparvata lugens]
MSYYIQLIIIIVAIFSTIETYSLLDESNWILEQRKPVENKEAAVTNSSINAKQGPKTVAKNVTHIMSGHKHVRDRILCFMRVLKDKSPTKPVVCSDIQYPSKGVLKNISISFIEVLDKSTDGHGGFAEILSGGPGQKSVKINLKSQPGYGLDFLIRIYGAYTPDDHPNEIIS